MHRNSIKVEKGGKLKLVSLRVASVDIYRVFPLVYVIERPNKLKERFRFLGDPDYILRKCKMAEKDAEKRVIDYIEGVGLLRINVHGSWRPTHHELLRVSKSIKFPIRHLAPLVAKSQKNLVIEGVLDLPIRGNVEVKIFPFGSCIIHLKSALQGRFTVDTLIRFANGEDITVSSPLFGKLDFEEFFEKLRDAVIYSIYSLDVQEDAKIAMSQTRHFTHIISSDPINMQDNIREIYGLVTLSSDWPSVDLDVAKEEAGFSLGKAEEDVVVIGERGTIAYTPNLKGTKPRRAFRESIIESVETAQAQYESLRIFKQRFKLLPVEKESKFLDFIITISTSLNPYLTVEKLLPRPSWKKYYSWTIEKISYRKVFDMAIEEFFKSIPDLIEGKARVKIVLNRMKKFEIPKVSRLISNILG